MGFLSKQGIIAYRITDKRHTPFDGKGAFLLGGRWNSAGQAVIYAASSFSGAILEKLVQTGRAAIPPNQVWIQVKTKTPVTIETFDLETTNPWNREDCVASRLYGDAWIQACRSVILVVPSVISPQETNIVINPNHPEFSNLVASDPQPMTWDQRLFQN